MHWLYIGTNTNAACETAVNTVDGSCFLLLRTADPAVCSGTCGTQVSTAATTCANVVSLINNYNLKTSAL